MKTWEDQPDALTDVPVVLSNVTVRDAHVEIRAHGVTDAIRDKQRDVYLTVGSLFGSQTIRCPNLCKAIEALNNLAHTKRATPASLPEGCIMIAG